MLENLTNPFVLIGSKKHNYKTLDIKVIMGETIFFKFWKLMPAQTVSSTLTVNNGKEMEVHGYMTRE